MSVNFFNDSIKTSDPEVYATLQKELERQQNQIELIAGSGLVKGSVCEEEIDEAALLDAKALVEYKLPFPSSLIFIVLDVESSVNSNEFTFICCP